MESAAAYQSAISGGTQVNGTTFVLSVFLFARCVPDVALDLGDCVNFDLLNAQHVLRQRFQTTSIARETTKITKVCLRIVDVLQNLNILEVRVWTEVMPSV